jgi:hypothetical protein
MLAVILTLPAVGIAQSTARSTDFRNFAYPWSKSFDSGLASISDWKWLGERGAGLLVLRNGRYDFGEGSGYLLVSSVTFGDLDGDGDDEAAVDLIRGSGGTANWHFLYIFSVRNRTPKPLGILRSGSRAYGGLTAVAIVNGVLILEFNDPKLATADCCSDGFIRVQYRFDGTRFVESVPRQRRVRKD